MILVGRFQVVFGNVFLGSRTKKFLLQVASALELELCKRYLTIKLGKHIRFPAFKMATNKFNHSIIIDFDVALFLKRNGFCQCLNFVQESQIIHLGVGYIGAAQEYNHRKYFLHVKAAFLKFLTVNIKHVLSSIDSRCSFTSADGWLINNNNKGRIQ